ncbi:hypothetical protein Acr_22g0010080 [Actinidia rufa]|uniref:Uncharacterized protein n=1 Tax=Actinidia rufa TaxID=165716 RepID=A0A7J0GLE7_9ERIC|nr:hypothetical protein Acr_22g0010080 [Actinidia rufa]
MNVGITSERDGGYYGGGRRRRFDLDGGCGVEIWWLRTEGEGISGGSGGGLGGDGRGLVDILRFVGFWKILG